MTIKTARAKYFQEEIEKWRVIMYPSDARSVDLGTFPSFDEAWRAAVDWSHKNGYSRP